ncbi:hypothetical protein GALL_161670 [mine drainage metagenome]|uniref:Uncharacterized protein n=1 Tax=mine drainage metagenome TaxID=410659 RepID=A0A1J5RZT5_9ZZZZ
MLRIVISGLALLLLSFASHAGCSAASNYNDCIIDAMKGVKSNVAAMAISDACRAKFRKKIVVAAVPQQVLAGLVGALGNGGVAGQLAGTVYNGNSDWAITNITVSVTAKAGKSAEARQYQIKILNTNSVDDGRGAMPQTNGLFHFQPNIDLSSGYDWKIVGAEGYRSR